jgi:antirestriction protein ArdC
MNVAEIVTNKIIDELEKGIIPWRKPWIGTNAIISHNSGKPYSFINQMLIGEQGEFITFKQIQAEGGKLAKGSKGKTVVFYKMNLYKDKDENGNEEIKKFPMLRYYKVFNIKDTDLKPKYDNLEPIKFNPIEKAETLANEYLTRENIKFNNVIGDKAFYSPLTDAITLPEKEQFPDTSEYYSTLFHEITHSTGAENRLNRKLLAEYHKSKEERSKEELIAEIGGAAMLAHLGIDTNESFKNTTAYIQGWLTFLKNDTKAIVSASSQAEKSHNFILNA